MAIWSRPIKWVKSKISPKSAAPPAAHRAADHPDDHAFAVMHARYIAGRLRELGMETYSPGAVDELIDEIGAANAVRVLDKSLERTRNYIKDGSPAFPDDAHPDQAWEADMHKDIRRYTPKGQMPNFRSLEPFWWYHPTRP